MHNIKIYSVLQHFDRIEQNRLRKYILSPYFNKNEALIHLFERLIQDINDPQELELTREKLWEELYPGKSYDDVRFRKLCSDLLKLVEGFLAQEEFEESSLDKDLYQMSAIQKKRLPKLYKGIIEKIKKKFSQQEVNLSDQYYRKYSYERNKYLIERAELDRLSKTNLDSILKNLDRFYLGEKLKYLCEILSSKSVNKFEYQFLFEKEIIEHLEKSEYPASPQISIYYQVYLTQVDKENEEHYFKLKVLLERHSLDFPIQETKEIYTNAINYCISKINEGKINFLEEFLDLNEGLVTKGILTKGELSPWRFQNIIIAALRLGRYTWTEEFINTHKSKLPEQFRENAVTFNMARLHWYQKNYNEVIKLLQFIEYEDFTYYLGSRAMLLTTYYETDEIEPLYSLMDSFRAYLRRKKDKLPKQRIDNYLQLINFVKKLTKIRPGDTKAIKQLKGEVENTKGVADEKWLLEKIADLE